MTLSVRKERILKAVIDDYIVSATPISSNEIRDKHLPSLSAATIRNELASLEDMGYLVQPHTSAGRIPTALAYKLYVDKLMPKKKLKTSELKIIKKFFNKQVGEVEDILRKTAKVISEVTNLTGVAFSGNPKEAVIENIKIVKLTANTVLIVVITKAGMLKDASVKVDEELSDEYYASASRLITDAFKGYTIGDVAKPGKVIKSVKKEYSLFFDTVTKILANYADGNSIEELVLEGASKILEQPEYASINKAKAILSIFDAKEQLLPLLQSSNNMDINIKIGRDDTGDKDVDCAIVTASYNVNGKSIGNAGVIGPMRMDYPKVISVLDYIGKTLNMLPHSNKNENTEIVENADNGAFNEEEL